MQIPLLKKGDLVGIVVPARKVDESLLMSGIKVIESWGLEVRLAEHCISDENLYLASSDENRRSDLQLMLDDTSIKAIFCARGGYGTSRILDSLQFSKFLQQPKWIIGFSDITALHLKLHKLGVMSAHGCMPTQYAKPEYKDSVGKLKDLLFEGNCQLSANHHAANKLGTANGQIIGGNLSLIVDSLATSSEPNTIGKILVVEEIDEPLYRVDRMFVHLKRAKILGQLAGLVVGHFTDISDTELPFNQSVTEIILDKVKECDYPVAFNFPIGHEAPNFPWRHNDLATLLVNETQSIITFTN